MHRLSLLIAASVLVAAGCGGDGSLHGDGARTYYESLELAAPTAAVETFTTAFAASDFPTVYIVMDREAQFAVQQNINLLQYSTIIGPAAIDAFRDWMQNEFSFEDMEPVANEMYLFDQMMLIAAAADDLLIDLRGDIDIGTAEVAGWEASVPADVEGIDGTVEFRLTKSPTDRWRVHQVIVPGGDAETIPWSTP